MTATSEVRPSAERVRDAWSRVDAARDAFAAAVQSGAPTAGPMRELDDAYAAAFAAGYAYEVASSRTVRPSA